MNIIIIIIIITEGNYGANYANDSAFNEYYIIIFYPYTYTLQENFIIDGQVISSGEILSEGNHYFPINISSNY